MAKAYILVDKDGDDYSSLPLQYEKTFLTKYVTCRPKEGFVDEMFERMRDILDEATPEDVIVFNGPSWLIAIAGYVWFSNPERATVRMLIYDTVTKSYKEYNNEYSV